MSIGIDPVVSRPLSRGDGLMDRDEHGAPNGVLRERAAEPVRAASDRGAEQCLSIYDHTGGKATSTIGSCGCFQPRFASCRALVGSELMAR